VAAHRRCWDVGVHVEHKKLDNPPRGPMLEGTMNATSAQPVPEDRDRLSWREICERFPDEWVVLVDTDWVNDTDFDFGGAKVVGHHKRRKDASADVKAAFAHHHEVGCFWTGKIRGPVPRLVLP
jgi:hypothetical protein